MDFDGVLSDSMDVQAEAWTQASLQSGLPATMADRLMRNLYMGNAGERMFDGLDLPASQRRKLRADKDFIWHGIRDQVPLMPGARVGVLTLADHASLAVATTADRSYVEHVLGREGLKDVFQSIQTDADGPYRKPMPQFLLALIAKHGDPSVVRAVMVGDSETDRRMSQEAGVRFVGFRKPSSPAVTWPHETEWSGLVPRVLHEIAT